MSCTPTVVAINLDEVPRPDGTDAAFQSGNLRRVEAAMSGLPYRITWKGSKIPRGAEIGGGTVAWAQHGRLLDEDGTMLATYRRDETFVGPGRDEHVMTAWVLQRAIR